MLDVQSKLKEEKKWKNISPSWNCSQTTMNHIQQDTLVSTHLVNEQQYWHQVLHTPHTVIQTARRRRWWQASWADEHPRRASRWNRYVTRIDSFRWDHRIGMAACCATLMLIGNKRKQNDKLNLTIMNRISITLDKLN